MSRRFVYSDPHFGHANIRFVPGNERFRDVTPEERDETIVENWNSVVTKRDVVYLLGDVGWDRMQVDSHGYGIGPKLGYVSGGVIPRLQGRIEVVGGNHDTAEILQHFDKVHGVLIKTVNNARVVFTHIPIHPQEMWWDYNVHGHLHGGTVKEYAVTPDHREIGPTDKRYINACGEHLNFTPQLLEDIVPQQDKKRKLQRKH
jgi:calcineurin-like phosphoesterase family protein